MIDLRNCILLPFPALFSKALPLPKILGFGSMEVVVSMELFFH